MNTAAPTDCLILLVTKGVQVEKPIDVLHVTTWGASCVQPRDLFMLHEGAEAEVMHRAHRHGHARKPPSIACARRGGRRRAPHDAGLQHGCNGPATSA